MVTGNVQCIVCTNNLGGSCFCQSLLSSQQLWRLFTSHTKFLLSRIRIVAVMSSCNSSCYFGMKNFCFFLSFLFFLFNHFLIQMPGITKWQKTSRKPSQFEPGPTPQQLVCQNSVHRLSKAWDLCVPRTAVWAPKSLVSPDPLQSGDPQVAICTLTNGAFLSLASLFVGFGVLDPSCNYLWQLI